MGLYLIINFVTFHGLTEDNIVLSPLREFTFAPSRVPIVNAPFSANFILPVPEASVPAVETCSETSAVASRASTETVIF